MEKGRPFDFERPYNDLARFWGFRLPGKQEQSKNDEYEWVCEFTSQKSVAGRVFADLNVLGGSVFDSIS